MGFFMDVGWMGEGKNYPSLLIFGNIHHEAVKLDTGILPTI